MNMKLSLIASVAVVCGFTTSFADDWPQWRGADRSDHSRETGLLKSWPTGGPRQVWLNEDVGLGYSGYSIVGGTLFTMGLRADDEFLIAVDAATGKERWATAVGGRLKNGWGDGPRSSPTVDDNRVYALGGLGDLICADAKTGRAIWKTSMSKLGGGKPGWGYCESVLVDGDNVVCTPGGRNGDIAALDKSTGKLVWQSSGFTEGAQYASIVPATIHGRRQYIQLTMKALVGIDASNGKLIWQSEWPGRTAVIPTPIVKGNEIYVASGYGVGSKKIRIKPDSSVETIWENKVMKNHHGGVILLGNQLYGYSDGPGWICQSWESGEEVWAEKRALRKGAIYYADERFYCLDETSGTVALIEASPKGWNEKGRFKLSPQTTQRNPKGKVWTHPVISDGKLFLRDQELLYCFDVMAK